MWKMNDSRWMASSIGTGLGDLAVFSGFDRDDLQAVLADWRLELAPVVEADADCYQIMREPWSDEAQRVCVSSRARQDAKTRMKVKEPDARAQPDGLAHLPCGHEDALVGRSGVVWISPGRRIARVAISPDCDDRLAFGELIGAALTHAMALVGCLPLHGMAAEINGIGVLALGDSMAGKSTLALAILHAGGRIVSDDFLLVRSVAGRIVVSALRRDLYIREGSFRLIPADLRELFSSVGAGLGRIRLVQDLAPHSFVDGVSPNVVWFLDGGERSSKLHVAKLSQAETLSSLLRGGSPLLTSKRYRSERLSVLPRLIQVVQPAHCFEVRLGSDLLHSPRGMIKELLEQLPIIKIP